jgi:hypothetical protein
MSDDQTYEIDVNENPAPEDIPDLPPRKLNPPILVSLSDEQHIDDIRARSIELAVQRGHLRREA